MTANENLKVFPLQDLTYYKIYGRHIPGQFPVPLFFNGSGIEVNVTGSELWIDIEVAFDTHEPWIFTRLNDSFMSRQMLMPGKQSICLFRGMSPEAVKNVKFFRELQAMSEDDTCRILVHGLRSDGSFQPVLEKKYKLEFIGDSITSGEGTYGATEDTDWLPMYMGISRNYALMVSDALDAEFRLFSQGGWGVLSGWDNDPRHNIPSRYEKLCGLVSGTKNDELLASEPYDFNSWKPDAIIINLGTNDASAFNQPAFTVPETGEIFKQRKEADGSFNQDDLNRFKQAVLDFLEIVRRNNLNSHIVWVYGMLAYDLTLAITDAMNSYKQITGDNNVAFLHLPNTTAETVGSHAHPGELSHARAAKVLTEYLESVLNN